VSRTWKGEGRPCSATTLHCQCSVESASSAADEDIEFDFIDKVKFDDSNAAAVCIVSVLAAQDARYDA
jgi:hypothetical protein